MSQSMWDTWLEEHLKTCETCRKAFVECENGMCETAFAEFQKIAREHPEEV